MTLFSRSDHLSEVALGDRARDARQWVEAASHYRSALYRNPDSDGVWVQFGHALKESGHLAQAERAYRRALEKAPRISDTHLQLGHVLKLQRRMDEARNAYLRALALDRACEHALGELSAFEWHEGELAEAQRAAESIAPSGRTERRDLSPNERADRARDLGLWEEAVLFYRKALDRNPDKPELWVQYGNMLKESGKLADAEDALRTALNHGPAAADTHLQLGHVFKISGQEQAALGAYLRAFVLDTTRTDALEELRHLGWTDSDLTALRRQVDDETPPADEISFARSSVESAPGENALSTFVSGPMFTPLVLPDPATMPNRQRLRDYLIDEQFGDQTVNRILDYFRLVEAVKQANDTFGQRRGTVLRAVGERLAPLAEAAADNRPIEASIIVPVYNHIEYTIGCVTSILEHRCDTRYEIIIADDVSTDETAALFSAVGGVVRCLTAETNGGFLINCNRAAEHVAGGYIVFLNNDTFVLDDWLDELLGPFDRFKDVGLVGSKLLMGDGTLQEAGGIIWSDGSGWNFGRGQDPRSCQFNYVKDADYTSGAAIAVPRGLWQELQGFDRRYIPAYSEDTDLAFRIRAHGLRTLYVPHSQVIHHEGVSHGTDITIGIKAHQVTNGVKFVEKWRSVLETQHSPNGENVFLARDRTRDRKHLLVFDHYVPKFDRDGGSRMMYDFLRLFVDAGLHVQFWPDNGHYDRSYAQTLQGFGIEVLYGPQVPHDFHGWIQEHGRYLDYVFLHRPSVSIRYIDDLCKYSPARRIYYGADLHFRRFEKEYAMTGRAEVLEEVKNARHMESYVWQRSDVIYYPAPEEVELVQQLVPDRRVCRFPVQLYADAGIRAARARVGTVRPSPPSILYVAGFAHRPNADAFLWFAREILPIIKARVPESIVICAGSFPPHSITKLARDDLIVTEAISWPVLDWFYNSASVAIGPIRYGGGMKGKLLEAMRYGVPVVSTTAGAEGFDNAEELMAIADTPKEFADRVVQIIRDRRSATRRVVNALDYIEANFSHTAVAGRLAAEMPELERVVQGHGVLRL